MAEAARVATTGDLSGLSGEAWVGTAGSGRGAATRVQDLVGRAFTSSSWGDERPVATGFHPAGAAELLLLTTTLGNEVAASGALPFLIGDGSMRRLDALAPGDVVVLDVHPHAQLAAPPSANEFLAGWALSRQVRAALEGSYTGESVLPGTSDGESLSFLRGLMRGLAGTPNRAVALACAGDALCVQRGLLRLGAPARLAWDVDAHPPWRSPLSLPEGLPTVGGGVPPRLTRTRGGFVVQVEPAYVQRFDDATALTGALGPGGAAHHVAVARVERSGRVVEVYGCTPAGGELVTANGFVVGCGG